MGGLLFFGGAIMRFDKLPKNYQEQLDLLISRGMQVANPDRAIRYLHI